MRVFFTILLILLLSALTFLGIEVAAQRTHGILGDSGYIPFIQEIIQ